MKDRETVKVLIEYSFEKDDFTIKSELDDEETLKLLYLSIEKWMKTKIGLKCSCGVDIQEGWEYCPYCGEEV